ncbi:hypothetical protein BpHYR1_046828 [Brachionus plicatilis]|uniref:Uncharacterized protein n=1 Tax=Brachionus plicatilis TaxID=10195 RepID=A0A3M7S0F7_BRAPC|nr:hypothetical protein BpHYR1_046828 [Brachionus plicatilis]
MPFIFENGINYKVLKLVDPVAGTRGHIKRVRPQSFTSKEINDYHKSVTARMYFFSNRSSGWWNMLPNWIVEANTTRWLVVNQWGKADLEAPSTIFYLSNKLSINY